MVDYRAVQFAAFFSVISCCLSLNPDHFILDTYQFPEDDRLRPAIGNGHVATNVLTDTVYMNGVMNGNGSDSHRARIPATSSIDVTDGSPSRHYSLDMLRGVFTQRIYRLDADIHLQYFAHRTMTRLLVTILTVHRNQPGDITLNLTVNSGGDSDDLEGLTTLHENDTVKVTTAHVKAPEVPGTEKTNICQYFTQVPDRIVLKAEKDNLTSVYITSTGTEQTDTELAYQRALSMSADELLQTHVEAWRMLWDEGRIEVNGDLSLAKTLNAAFYYILSSTPLNPDPINPFRGLSPGGLSRGGIAFPNKTTPFNDYLGHVFWDMDTWMLPPIMAFHPQLASIMIGSRTRALPQARQHANRTGYKGARFPWEQGESGAEVCPWLPATLFQIHVTADVSLALRQYLYATDDVSILTKRKGLELAMDIARFWKSRVVKREDNLYEILGVMGPDEYHININNSVFTNYNAKVSLQLPGYIQDTYNLLLSESDKREIQDFSEIAENMLILFNEDKQYHPQFQGFSLNESIKLSDVVLLGFPLMMPMSKDVRRNDLQIYENLTDRFGPDAGTWSMHTLTHLELGDEQAAADDTRMMLRNINGPFKVFSEKPSNSPDGISTVNFITAAGGLLQAYIFGYGGIRVHRDRLEIKPHIISRYTEWAIRGFHYRGFIIDIEIRVNKFRLLVLKEREGRYLYMTDDQDSHGEVLKLGVAVQRPLSMMKISVRKQEQKTACVFSSAQNCTNQQFVLETDEFPRDDRFRPAVGNGHVATNVLSDRVYMNGVMNGDGSDSHRARIPATSSIDIKHNNHVSTRHYSLDMFKGVFTQYIARVDAAIRLQYFAHRTMTPLLVTILTVHRNQPGDITLNLTVNRGGDSEDLEDQTTLFENSTLMVTRAHIKTPEVPGTEKTNVYQYYTPVPNSVILEAGKDNMTSVYITSTGTEQTDTELAYQRALCMSADDLLQSHVLGWRDLWEKGHLEVNEDVDLARTVNAGLYYILSSIPLTTDQTNPFRGVSPGGLSRGGIVFPNKTMPYNDYMGHVFWDMDTWMLPPIMAFHPQLASIMIGSRTRALPQAIQLANKTGYKGARFPWEQGESGGDVCPWPAAAEYEIHVTADVSLALRQYLYATDDVSILTNRKGLELAMDIARFWKSRVVKNGDHYEIRSVMGPDEYHVNVSNSVFTNYNAKLSLQLPAYIRDSFNLSLNATEKEEIKDFSEIAEKILILFDEEKQYHPQFQGFSLNEPIQQSDVVLLGFPLMMPMSPEVRRNDLIIYENLTDRFGPDTGTWSMYTLTRLELDDEDAAADDFRMIFRNINGPFKVFSEKPPNNPQGVRAVNFITGAGGLLQAVIFGYGGIRLNSDHLEIRPHMLPKSTEWAIRGLHYRGYRLDIVIVSDKYKLSVLNERKDTYLYLTDEESIGETLKIGVVVERPMTKVKISVRNVDTNTKPPVSSIWRPRSSVCLIFGAAIINSYGLQCSYV